MWRGNVDACPTGRHAKATSEWRANSMRHGQVNLMLSFLKKWNYKAGRMRVVLNSHRSTKKKCCKLHVHLLCLLSNIVPLSSCINAVCALVLSSGKEEWNIISKM